MLLKLYYACEQPGSLMEVQILILRIAWSLRFCISDKLSGDADAASMLAILEVPRVLQDLLSAHLSRLIIYLLPSV